MYKIDFVNNTAIEKRVMPSGKVSTKRFMLFIDENGVNILKRDGKEYMTQKNCEVML